MADPEKEAEDAKDAPKSTGAEAETAKPMIAEPPQPIITTKDFADDDRARETMPAQRLRGRLEAEHASVIVDPTIARVEVSERQRVAIEKFADRARFLALACFIASGLTLVVTVVSLFGRIEPGVLFFLIPTGIANFMLGILLRRAAAALTASMLPTQLDEKPMLSAFDDLSMAFGVQIVATGLFAALLFVLLLGALLVRRMAEL